MKIFLLIAILLSPFALCRAELPPSAYEMKQKTATDLLNIVVLRVTVEPGDEDNVQKIDVLARVDSVNRSASNIKVNDLVTIVYTITHRPQGWVGPGEIPLLTEGQSTIAYLNPIPDTSNYAPAAGRMSFSNF